MYVPFLIRMVSQFCCTLMWHGPVGPYFLYIKHWAPIYIYIYE
jgi:hypothetical protein